MSSAIFYAKLLLFLAEYCVSGYVLDAACRDGSSVPQGYQAIILGAPFKHNGSITAINAVMSFDTSNFAHAIYLQVWRPTGPSAFTVVSEQYFFADPAATYPQPSPKELNFPAQFKNTPPIQLSFLPNDVLGYYVVTNGALIADIGRAFFLSPLLINSSQLQPSSINVYTSNSSGPLQNISISGSPAYTSVHPLITITYITSSPSPNMSSTVTVLGACPVSSTPGPSNSATPTPSSSIHQTTTYLTSAMDVTSSSIIPPISPLFTSSATPPPNLVTPPTSLTLTTAIVSAVAGGVCVILLLGIIATIVCIYRRRSTSRLPKSETGADALSMEEIVHYEKQGVLYALPDKQKEGVPRPKIEDQTNIESYASSYQVNGQLHMYQEPKDALGMVASPLYQQIPADTAGGDGFTLCQQHTHQSQLTIPRPSEVAPPTSRSRISLTSPSHMPCTPYSDPQASLPPPQASLPPPQASLPPHSRSRTLSTNISRPHLPQNPIATLTRPLPPRPHPSHNSPVALDEHQKPGIGINKLFTELDEQGFHVPSSLERQSFQGSSHQDIYSRLAHPRNRNSQGSNFFEQNDMFWNPPSSSVELYDVLSKKKYREIPRNSLRSTLCSTSSNLGSGNFGVVFKGEWSFSSGHLEVAIKMLKDGASEEDRVKFLQEAAIMGQFSHPNVVKLYGVVTVGNPLLLVLELIPNGDLRNYVTRYRERKSTRHPSPVPIPASLPKTFVAFARDISCGMAYLSKKNFVHRDLAARNIFLTDDLRCKIGDFGMARDLAQGCDNIYQSQGGKIPLKWSAPEAIQHYQYNTSSDVWSFGMVLYEVWSLGHKPFSKLTPEKLRDLVTTGYCQPPPPGCPRAIYDVMVKCWHPKAAERPSFSELYHHLGKPVEDLLVWSEEDRQCGEQVSELGAPMACSRNLYPDLQNMYTASTYV